jgi:hypothetical protein
MTWSRYGQDLQLQRVWCGWTCIQALLAGAAHMSAPYMVLDGCAPSAAYPFLPPPPPPPCIPTSPAAPTAVAPLIVIRTEALTEIPLRF